MMDIKDDEEDGSETNESDVVMTGATELSAFIHIDRSSRKYHIPQGPHRVLCLGFSVPNLPMPSHRLWKTFRLRQRRHSSLV